MSDIVIRAKLADSRFCNALEYGDGRDCPCLRTDDYFGDPESCNLDYDISIKWYSKKRDDIKDDLGTRKYSGYPYGYQKVSIRPDECIQALSGNCEHSPID